MALRFVDTKGAVARPSWGELIQAWLDETVQAPGCSAGASRFAGARFPTSPEPRRACRRVAASS